MPAVDAEHVLGGNRNQRAEGIRPKCRGTNQDPHTDTGDVSARQVWPLARKDARQNQFGDEAYANRQQGARVALEDAVRQLPYQ